MNHVLKNLFLTVITLACLGCLPGHSQTVSHNSGSLGSAGDAVNTPGVTVVPGAITAGGDTGFGYNGLTALTSVAFNSTLNPPASSPFTVEFWLKPTADVGSVFPCPLFNRVSSSPRSGWIFFQGTPTDSTVWNFRMYNGVSQSPAIDLSGGSTSVNNWSYLAAVWDGTTASLFWNGNLVASGTGPYQPNAGASLTIGNYDTGIEGFTGSVDEVAIYLSALSASQIATHYSTASSSTPGAYSSLVIGDGAVEYLQAVPEPSSASLLLFAAATIMGWRFVPARKRQA